MAEPTALICNPAAGRGRIRAHLPRIRAAFERIGKIDFYQTAAAGEEATLAQRAIATGARVVVAVGGDGTCSQIANAIVNSNSNCALAVVPGGTGNDFAKTLGVERARPEQIADLVARDNTERIDVGRVDRKVFLNSCGFGFDASVLAASNRVTFLKGDAVYIYSALKQLFSYRGIEISAGRTVSLDSSSPAPLLMVTVSNGQYLGGAFHIAPRASVTDGKLDVCFFEDCGVFQRIRLFAGALRGSHLGMRAVTTATADKLELTFASPPSMEIDGELRVAQSAVVHLECMPRALSVIAAPGALTVS